MRPPQTGSPEGHSTLDALELRLTQRMVRVMLVVGPAALWVRASSERTIVAGLVLSGLILLALAAIRRRPSARHHVTFLIAMGFYASTIAFMVAYTGDGFPAGIAFGTSLCLVFSLLGYPRVAWLAFGCVLVRAALGAALASNIPIRQWDLFWLVIIATLCLHTTGLAYRKRLISSRQRLTQQRQVLQDVTTLRTRLMDALLRGFEKPLRDTHDPGLRAEQLIDALNHARQTRDAIMPSIHPDTRDPTQLAPQLLSPLLFAGLLSGVMTVTQGIAFRAPNALVGLPITVLILSFWWLARTQRVDWQVIAWATVSLICAGMAVDAALVEPHVAPSGMAFAVVVIAFGGLWLGARASFLITTLVITLALWVIIGRSHVLHPEMTMLFKLWIAEWIFVVLLVAPVADAQEARLELFRQQHHAIAASLRVRRRLLGTLFHDVANHLTVLSGVAEFRTLGLATDALLEREARVLTRLDALINSARHWLFVDAPFSAEQLSTVPVKQLGDAMRDLFHERLRDKQLSLNEDYDTTLTVACVPEVLADGVLGNLISNAIKFSDPQSTIEFKGRRDGEQVILEILDRGPGIPEQVIERVNAGEDAPSQPGSQGEQGMGLGLALASEHLRRMGGALEFQARPGGGTCSRIILTQTAT